MASQVTISSQTPAASGHGRLILGYGGLIAGTVVSYLVIRAYGETLIAPTVSGAAAKAQGGAARGDTLLHVLLALVTIIILARVLGGVFRFFNQPPVIGEIIAGIALGPSLLGRLAPAAEAYMFPTSMISYLDILAEIGVILYMFLVGLELDPGLLKRRGHAAVAISHASIAAPFMMGAGLALFLYPRLSSAEIHFTGFSLFLGVSMSITAFPVLARILTDRGMHKSRMGALALTCAAVDDVTAWCLLALVVSVLQARTAGAVATFGMAIAFIGIMIFVVRPVMVRLTLAYGNRGRMTQGVMAAIFVALLLSAWATDIIGIHAIFGAFALGAVIPHDSGLARDLTDRLEDLLVVLLLPAFFAYTGLRTQIGLVSGAQQWTFCALIILVASAGKFGGSAVAARLTGLSWRDSAALGILMNTRGLVELIALNIGLDFGVISPALFAMLVVMALITTFATTPILSVLSGGELTEDRHEQVQRAEDAKARGEDLPMIVAVSNPQGLPSLIEIAMSASMPEGPPPRVLALVRRPPGGVRSGLREVEQRVPPRAQILLAAIEFAKREHGTIETMAVWSDDPARDIVQSAVDANAGWVFIGFHRPVFGVDAMGGTVHEVLEHARRAGVNVGVVTRGEPNGAERIFALVDDTSDGRAALTLATRIARKRNLNLHAVLVPAEGADPETQLKEFVKDASKIAGKWLYTDVLRDRNPVQLVNQTPGQLVLVGKHLAEDLALPINMVPEENRCVVVVQGAA